MISRQLKMNIAVAYVDEYEKQHFFQPKMIKYLSYGF